MLKIKIIPVTPFAQNCSVVWCETTKDAIVVDPGGDLDKIESVIKANELNITQIVLTHGHLDHVGGTVELSDIYGVDIIGPHKDDDFWLAALGQQSQRFGFPPASPFTPNKWLEQGDMIKVGNETLEVRHCPGHTPGHVVLVSESSGWVIAADVLFKGSIGRTDFPRGNFDDLAHSIRTQLYTLPDNFTVYPGHGMPTTIGAEKVGNAFVKAQ